MARAGSSTTALGLLFLVAAPAFSVASNYMKVEYTIKQDICATPCAFDVFINKYICYMGRDCRQYTSCQPSPENAWMKLPGRCKSFCSQSGNSDRNWCVTGIGGQKEFCTPEFSHSDSLFKMSKILMTKYCHGANNSNADKTLSLFKRNLNASEETLQLLSLNDGIAILKRMMPDHVITIAEKYQTQSPVTEYLTVIAPHIFGMENNEALPLYIRARIKHRHRTSSRETMPNYIRRRMANMNALLNDESCYLLPPSLGGPTANYNFVPRLVDIRNGFMTIGRLSLSYYLEQKIHKFLDANPANTSYVLLDVMVFYGNLSLNRRPIGFGLQALFYNNNSLVDGDTFVINNNALTTCCKNPYVSPITDAQMTKCTTDKNVQKYANTYLLNTDRAGQSRVED